MAERAKELFGLERVHDDTRHHRDVLTTGQCSAEVEQHLGEVVGDADEVRIVAETDLGSQGQLGCFRNLWMFVAHGASLGSWFDHKHGNTLGAERNEAMHRIPDTRFRIPDPPIFPSGIWHLVSAFA